MSEPRELDDLLLSVRIQNVLKNYGKHIHSDNGPVFVSKPITTIRQLLALTKADLLRCPNFGRVSLAELEAELACHGLQLGHPPPDWYCAAMDELT